MIIEKEAFMRAGTLGMVFLFLCTVARSQSLGGLFSQGATEIAQNETQIAALQLLGSTMDDGYGIIEDGLTGISLIHRAEFGLHKQYFASLSAVNPVVARMPEIQDALATEQAIVTGLSAAVGRWRTRGVLTTDELSMADGIYQRLCELGSEQLTLLQGLLTDRSLTMTDAERMARVRALDAEVRSEQGFAKQWAAEMEALLAERQAGRAVR